MDITEILKIRDPYVAAKEMAQKVRNENLPISEMENMVEIYTKFYGIAVDDMLSIRVKEEI